MKLKEIYKLQKELMYTDMGGHNGPDGINEPSDVLHRVIDTIKFVINNNDDVSWHFGHSLNNSRFLIGDFKVQFRKPDLPVYPYLKVGDEALRKLILSTLHPHALISYIHLEHTLGEDVKDTFAYLEISIVKWLDDRTFHTTDEVLSKKFSELLMAFILDQPERRSIGLALNPNGLDYKLTSPVPVNRPWWKFWE